MPSHRAFDRDVGPLLEEFCTPCHNDKKANAGVNMTVFGDAASLAATREGWELILSKLRAGEMPPIEEEQPDDKARAALVAFVQSELDRADRHLEPDPGHVPILSRPARNRIPTGSRSRRRWISGS